MKKLLILTVLVLLVGCKSAPVSQEQKFEKIFSFPDESKENLYEKSLSWIKRYIGGEMIMYQDPEEGKILFNIERKPSGRTNLYSEIYTIYSEIDVKEGRTRITLTFEPVSIEEIEKNREEIFKDYESYLKKKKANNW